VLHSLSPLTPRLHFSISTHQCGLLKRLISELFSLRHGGAFHVNLLLFDLHLLAHFFILAYFDGNLCSQLFC